MLFDAALAEGIKLIRDITTDKDQQAILEANYRAALLNADKELAVSQIKVNEEEAKHLNIFVAGWRPAAGWVCVCSLAYHYIMQPFLTFLCAFFQHNITLPTFDMYTLYTILMGMLGLGTLRTAEKTKGVAS
mgnify:CR=1 FL=1